MCGAIAQLSHGTSMCDPLLFHCVIGGGFDRSKVYVQGRTVLRDRDFIRTARFAFSCFGVTFHRRVQDRPVTRVMTGHISIPADHGWVLLPP